MKKFLTGALVAAVATTVLLGANVQNPTSQPLSNDAVAAVSGGDTTGCFIGGLTTFIGVATGDATTTVSGLAQMATNC